MRRVQITAVALLWAACSGTHERSLPSTEGISTRDGDVAEEADDGGEAGDAADENVDAAVENIDARIEEDAGVARSAECSFDLDATPMEHEGAVNADETWGPGVHLITFSISVRAGATLTIAPCALIRVRTDQLIDVRDGATLIAEGTVSRPIRFEPESAGAKWSTIYVQGGGHARFAYATIRGAGRGTREGTPALLLRGVFDLPAVRVQHVVIEGAPMVGVSAEEGAQFSRDSIDLTVTGAGDFPIVSHPGSAGSLPSGTYTGNARDEILLVTGAIQRDMTLRDLGVPYHVGTIGSRNTSLRVATAGSNVPGVPLLTIEAGVRLRFEPAAIMQVEHFTGTGPASGALRVMGSAERPVVFTSAASPPAAGDWVGIWFGGVPDMRNLIDHARIEYAGGVTGTSSFGCDNPAAPADQRNRNRAAVLILGPVSSRFIHNTTIAHSASDGIERGYSGAPVDFLESNTFENIAWCQQSYPRPASGTCPMPIPCPR